MNRSIIIGTLAAVAIVTFAALLGANGELSATIGAEQHSMAPYSKVGRPLAAPGQLSPPGRTSRPGNLTGPGKISSPGRAAAQCRKADDNAGFELGSVDSNQIPCWTVVDQSGGFGSWCTQAGTAPPQGSCAGDSTLVQPPPVGLQAAMTNQGGPGSHVLYQCGTLRSSRVAFQLYINNQAGVFWSPPSLGFQGQANQQFRADLVKASAITGDPFTVGSADVLLNLYRSAPGDAPISGYTTVTVDTSALVRASVCLRFAEVDNQLFFHVGVDDVQMDLRPGSGR